VKNYNLHKGKLYNIVTYYTCATMQLTT